LRERERKREQRRGRGRESWSRLCSVGSQELSGAQYRTRT